MNIIHILPKINHGGGIGEIFSEVRALRQFEFEAKITIVSLEPVFSSEFMLKARSLGIRLIVSPQKDTLLHLLQQADLLVISYWNHPLLSDFLIWLISHKIKIPIILSLRVNGLTLPQVLPSWVIQCASGIIYSHPDTLSRFSEALLPPIHYFSPHFIHLANEIKKSERDDFTDFVAFYAGSLNKFKRHPHLFDLHDQIQLSQGRIEYWGAGEDPYTIDRLANLEVGIHKGFSKNIFVDFKNHHLLLNPQSSLSYGANDKIRIECAYMGIPSLVLRESRISSHVESGIDGLIASDEKEYIEMLNWLAEDVNGWNLLSESTYHHIHKTYQLEKIVENIVECYRRVCLAGHGTHKDILLPQTKLSKVLYGMGDWAEFLISSPEKLSKLEIEYALHCEGGLIHHANSDEIPDEKLNMLIGQLFIELDSRKDKSL
jgi:hypothetical protein